MKLFAVRDRKADYFQSPFFAPSKADALRSFQGIANDKDHIIGKFPEDFELFELGGWDKQSGRYSEHERLMSLGVAVEFISASAPVSVVR